MIRRHEPRFLTTEARPWFEHQLTRVRYSRVVSGFSWPHEAPGYVVVVGERMDLVEGVHRLDCLLELKCPNVNRLYRAASVCRRAYCSEDTFGSDANPAMKLWLSLDDIEAGGISVVPLPGAGESRDFFYLVQLITQALNSPKRLFMNDCHDVRAELSAITPEAITGDGTKNPAVTALGYAVGALMMGPTPEAANHEYEPLDQHAGY